MKARNRHVFALTLLLFSAHTFAYQCDGRTHCSQMTSCEEATWFLQHCPNTQMDGNGDGVPCEKQWCNGTAASSKPLAPVAAPADSAKPARISLWVPGQQLLGSGEVIKLLPDDNNGSRHQRFIVRSEQGPTLLIAHNIDLAPRIDNLAVGDKITFYGVYESNDKGGLVHWTHRDPAGVHTPGWIRHGGRKYE